MSAVQMSERELQSAVLELARLRGWLCAHFRPARTEQGWRTPVEADGKGFPDLVMVRGDRLIFAELKAEKGRLSPEQERWLGTLWRLGVIEVETHVWRPSDWTSGNIDGLLA